MFTDKDEEMLQALQLKKKKMREELSTQLRTDDAFMYGSLRGIENITDLTAFLKRNKKLVSALTGWTINENT